MTFRTLSKLKKCNERENAEEGKLFDKMYTGLQERYDIHGILQAPSFRSSRTSFSSQ